MPPNPAKAVMDYLRGRDIPNGPTPTPPVERKLIYYNDIGAALKAGTLIHGPGATEILQGVYGNTGNSAVFACLTAICTAYPLAPLRVFRASDDPGSRDLVPESPLQVLLDDPNPAMSAPELWSWVQWAKHVDGNAFLRKIRAENVDTGNVIELWPISPSLIFPVTVKGSGDFLSYWKYQYAPGKWERIEKHNIVHLRLGVDDGDHRLGYAPLKRLVREVASSDSATRFADQLLRNFAVPGLVVTVPDEGEKLTKDEALEIKASVAGNFGNENRGNVAVLTNGADVKQFGFSPEQLSMEVLHRVPEERISAVLRVPAIIAGLGAGLARATYANFKEAREMFTEQTILPLYQFDAAKLNTQLLPDFSSDRRVYLQHDISDLRALQEDEDKKYARITLAFEKKLIARNEGRAELGWVPMEGPENDEIQNTPPPPQLPGPTRDEVRLLPPPAKAKLRELVQKTKELRTAMGPATTYTASYIDHTIQHFEDALETKAEGVDLERFPEILAAMRELATPAFEADVAKYLDGARLRIKRAVLKEA